MPDIARLSASSDIAEAANEEIRRRLRSASGFSDLISRYANKAIVIIPAPTSPQASGRESEICALMRPAEKKERPIRARIAEKRGTFVVDRVFSQDEFLSSGKKRALSAKMTAKAARSNTKMECQPVKLTSRPPSNKPKGAPRVIAMARMVRTRITSLKWYKRWK